MSSESWESEKSKEKEDKCNIRMVADKEDGRTGEERDWDERKGEDDED